ncbi:MAG: AI-2E family transporter [Hyphomicrobium sp.]|nr:AI-2E family transporter [Hyphomicrobium sp.]
MPTPTTPMTEAVFIRRVLIVVGILAFAAALYLLSDIMLLAFGSVLVAVVLRAIAQPIYRGTSLSRRLSLAAAGLGVVVLLGGIGYLFGAQINSQLATLIERLPAAAAELSKSQPFLSMSELVKGSSVGNLVASALSWGTTVFGALATLVVVVLAGVYMAIQPDVYRNGFVMLFPKRVQGKVSETIDDAGEALRLWLGAQLLAMILVGVLTGAGLVLIGVPSALALGFIAGMLEFVPIIGPVVAAVPALLLASTQSWEMVAWTLALFVVVQQIESNIIMPLVSGRAVKVPPAVGLFAVVAIGILFGPLGLLLGYPLAIVTDVAVRRLYVREMLGEKVEIAGETAVVEAARSKGLPTSRCK